MQTVTLYSYIRPDGGQTNSPIEPDMAYELAYRLIAEEGMGLTKDGIEIVQCIDVPTTDGWYEVPLPLDEDGNINTEQLLSELEGLLYG